MKETHIFICNRDRLQPLEKLVEILLKCGYFNIVILDNQSTYEPLLKWYDTLKETSVVVHRCKENYGHTSLDRCLEYEDDFRLQYQKVLSTQYFVYTDSDVVPIDEIPENFIDDMIEMSKKHNISKLGLSLKIDDLPDHFMYKKEVIEWEKQFFSSVAVEDANCVLYRAAVDTTFAVHRPGMSCGYRGDAFRTGGNYFARHYPWYYNTANLPEDELHYCYNLGSSGHWSNLVKNAINDKNTHNS